MLPRISVLLPTYERHDVLAQTITLLDRHLVYSGDIRYIVGDDSAIMFTTEAPDVTVLRGPQRGLGANLNTLIRYAGDDLMLQMDDDHHLHAALDLTPHAQALLADERNGWIRLMQVGGHHYRAMLDQQYWRIDWASPELYIPSNRPHLKHPRFHRRYGLYPEGVRLGGTEEGFCHQAKRIALTHGGPDVLVPLDAVSERGWRHVGQSWQAHGL